MTPTIPEENDNKMGFEKCIKKNYFLEKLMFGASLVSAYILRQVFLQKIPTSASNFSLLSTLIPNSYITDPYNIAPNFYFLFAVFIN